MVINMIKAKFIDSESVFPQEIPDYQKRFMG